MDSSGIGRNRWLTPPCNSFSRARDRHADCVVGRAGQNVRRFPPPLRSDDFPYGLTKLGAHDARKVREGNALGRFSISVFTDCDQRWIPANIEIPHTGRLWKLSSFRQARLRPTLSGISPTFCQDGTPWIKRTAFLPLHLDMEKAVQCCLDTVRALVLMSCTSCCEVWAFLHDHP